MASGLNASRIHASKSSDRKTLPRALQTRSAGDGAFFLGRLDLAACLRATVVTANFGSREGPNSLVKSV